MNTAIIITIIATLLFDGIAGHFVTKSKRNKQKQKDDIFLWKLGTILDKPKTTKEAIDEAKDLCRMTEGEVASGAYCTLDMINV